MNIWKRENAGELTALITGLCLLVLCAVMFLKSPAHGRQAGYTRGIVVGSEWYWMRHYYLVEFRAHGGTHRFRMESRYPGQYEKGELVSVVFDDSDPTNAHADTFWMRWGRWSLAVPMSVFLVGYGLTLFFRKPKQKDAKKAADAKPDPSPTPGKAVAKPARKSVPRKKSTARRSPPVPTRAWKWTKNKTKFEVSVNGGRVLWVELAPGDYWSGGGYGRNQTLRGFLKNGAPENFKAPPRIAVEVRGYILKHRPELAPVTKAKKKTKAAPSRDRRKRKWRAD